MARRAVAQAAPHEPISVVSQSFGRHLRAEGKSPETIKTYAKAALSLAAYLPDGAVAAEVTRVDIENWLNNLREVRHHSPATLSQRYRSVQQLFRWMRDEGDIPRSPLDGLAPPRIPDTPPPVMTDDQQRALLQACAGTSFAARRDAAIIRLFMSTGIRRGEMAGLRLADLDMDREQATVTGKGGHTRAVTFGKRATQALDRYIRLRTAHRHAGEPELWLGERGGLGQYGIEQIVKRVAVDAGVPWVSCHSFRHTWAAGALALGLHEQDVSALAGWRSPQMVTRYGRAVRDDRARANHRANNPGDRI